METKTSTIFKFQIFYFQGRGILSILNCEYIFLYIYIYLRYEIWILWNLRHERQVQLTDAIIIFIVLNRNKNITVHYDDITEERWRNIRNINRKGFSKHGGISTEWAHRLKLGERGVDKVYCVRLCN